MPDAPRPPGIPEHLLPDWTAIRSALAELQLFWQFHDRFCGNQEDVAMMMEVLLCPFLILRTALLFTMVMQVRSLLDPAKSRGRDNASLARFVGLLKEDHPALHAKLATLLKGIQDHCKPIETWGNRRIGHADLLTVAGREAMPDVPQQDFERALAMMRDLLQEVYSYFCGADASVDLRGPIDGADKLLGYIRAGREAELAAIEAML